MLWFRKNIIALASFILLLLLTNCKSDHLKKVDVDQKEQFAGTLQREMFYGPPGFGEDTTTDEKEPCYILHLDPLILFRDTIQANDVGLRGDTCGYDTIKTIQVRFDPESNVNGRNLRNEVGKKITITCTLYGAFSGHHHAAALTEKVFSIKER
jgi:hypothetical protein